MLKKHNTVNWSLTTDSLNEINVEDISMKIINNKADIYTWEMTSVLYIWDKQTDVDNFLTLYVITY